MAYAQPIPLGEQSIEQKLSKAIKISTVSNSNYEETDYNTFIKLQQELVELFPLCHEHMTCTVVNSYSLVYCWEGCEQKKLPMLVTAHQDVVPIEEGTEKDWHYPPFSGEIAEGKVWGRGTLDIKVHLITALEAVEQLIKIGYQPKNTIYFAFGHDEEVGGKQGAIKICEYFKQKGISFEFVLDEGGCVIDEAIEGIDKPLALIGIGEKGYANIKIAVKGHGGHAAMPPKFTAVTQVAKIIQNINNHPMDLILSKPVEGFFNEIGPHMKGINKFITTHLGVFKNIFMKQLAKTNQGNAMVRTTIAPTMIDGSMEPNVLPQEASVTINSRIIPGNSGETLMQHIKDINKGISLDLEVLRLEEPSAVSSTNTIGYRLISKEIQKIYSDAIVAPYLVLAGTDARKYEPISNCIYRFTPYRIHQKDMSKMHGTNECISIENIQRCCDFFVGLFKSY